MKKDIPNVSQPSVIKLRYAKAQVSFLGVAGYFAEPVTVTQSEHVEKKCQKIFFLHDAFDWIKPA